MAKTFDQSVAAFKPLALAIVVALQCSHAAAEDKTLAPVKVIDGTLGNTTEGTGSYAAGAVNMGKGEQSLREIPQSVSVVTRQRLDDQNVTTLPEAMKFVTGITVQRFDGAGFFNTFNARGYAADTFQIDGVNVQINANMADMDLAVFDRVEIQRGAAGMFQGSGEPGVSVNLVRKRALAETKVQGVLSAGSWDTYRAETDVTGRLSNDGRLRGRLLLAYDDRDSYLDVVGGNKQLAYATVEYDILPSTTLALGYTWQKVASIIDQGLPAYASGRLADVSRSTAIVADWNALDMETSDYFGELEHQFANGAQAKLIVRYLDRYRLYKGQRANGEINPNTGVFDAESVYFPTDLDDKSADLFYSTPLQLFGLTHQFTVGTDYRSGENESPFSAFRYSPNTSTSNIFGHSSNTQEPALIGATGSVTRTDIDQKGIYARAKIHATENFSVLLGGRVSWWESETHDLTRGTVGGKFDEKGEFTPYAAVMFDFSEELSWYASYADIFKPQNNQDRDGNQIDPRTGEQYETGIKGKFAGGLINTHAAIYWMEDKNRALTITETGRADYSVAGGKVRSKGFEAEISGQVTPRWQLTAGYAYTTTEYLEAAPAIVGESFAPFTPRHNFNLWSKYSFSSGALRGFDVGGGLRAVSNFYASSGVIDFDAPGYATVSLQGGYKITENLRVALNIDNLFDRKYYEKVSGAGRQNFYGAPRSAAVTLRANY